MTGEEVGTRLLRAEQPPPGRLPADVVVQLDAVGDQGLDRLAIERSPVSRDAGDDLHAFGHALDRRRERRLRLPPPHSPSPTETNPAAPPEPPAGAAAPRRCATAGPYAPGLPREARALVAGGPGGTD